MEGEGIQKGEGDRFRHDADRMKILLEARTPEKKAPRTIEEAIRAGDWAALSKIQLNTIASLERDAHEDVDGDGKILGSNVNVREEAGLRSENSEERSSYLDANGRDPYGFKFYSNYGYDAKGNYRDSFGGTLNAKTGEYTTEDGVTSDLKHGLTYDGDDVYNHVTKRGVVKIDGTYYAVQLDENGKPQQEKNPDGTYKTLTEKERNEFIEEGRRQRERTDAEILEIQKRNQGVDKGRDAYAKKSGPPATTQVDDVKLNPELPRGVTGKLPDINGDASGPPPNPYDNVGVKTSSEDKGTIELMRETVRQNLNAHVDIVRNVRSTVKNNRIHALGVQIGQGGESAPVISDTEKNNLMFGRKYNFDRVPKYKLGDATPKANLAKAWVKDNLGGVWDEFGGYYDNKGGYYDRQGGYFDKDGGYTDQYGGYMAKDGSYIDNKGNFVDAKGNLWLAGDNSGQPSFPARPGVNWVDVLAKAQENRYGEITDGNALSAEEAKAVGDRLKKIDADKNAIDRSKAPKEDPNNTNKPAVTAFSQSVFFSNSSSGTSSFMSGTSLSSLNEPPPMPGANAPAPPKREPPKGPRSSM